MLNYLFLKFILINLLIILNYLFLKQKCPILIFQSIKKPRVLTIYNSQRMLIPQHLIKDQHFSFQYNNKIFLIH